MPSRKEIAAAKATLALATIQDARKDLSAVEASMKLRIAEHAKYVDKLGKKSSGARGLALQVNIRIKKAFDHDRDHMDLDQMLMLKALLAKIVRIILEGEQASQSRKAIKMAIYAAIDDYGILARKTSDNPFI